MTPHALAGTLISHAAGLTSNAAAAELICRPPHLADQDRLHRHLHPRRHPPRPAPLRLHRLGTRQRHEPSEGHRPPGRGGDGRHNRSHRPRPRPFCPHPWPACPPASAAHGHVADGDGPEPRLRTRKRRSAAYSPGRRTEVCKTVGSAYVGSNPTPVTTSGNGPWLRKRARGPFCSCHAVYRGVSPWVDASRCPRTYSGRRPCRQDGRCAPSAFHGRPRTGRAGGRCPA